MFQNTHVKTIVQLLINCYLKRIQIYSFTSIINTQQITCIFLFFFVKKHNYIKKSFIKTTISITVYCQLLHLDFQGPIFVH